MSNLTDFIGHNIIRSATEPTDKTKFWFNETDFKLHYYDYSNLAWVETTKKYINTAVFDIFGDNSAIALYQLDGNALDTGGAYNGTATSVTYGAGKFGQAASFNGSSSYIELNTEIPNFNTAPFSVSLWINLNNLNSIGSLFALLKNNEIKIGGFTSSSVLEVQVKDSSRIDITNSINVGTFQHVVIVADGSNINVYVDTSNKGTSTYSDSGNAGRYDIFGAYPNSTTNGDVGLYFNGLIDQVRIFNKALTVTEVNTLYTEV